MTEVLVPEHNEKPMNFRPNSAFSIVDKEHFNATVSILKMTIPY